MPDLDAIAATPKRVKTDAGEVESRPLDEVAEAADIEVANEAVNKAHRGLRFSRLVPPGTA